jgi:hypothetical protein
LTTCSKIGDHKRVISSYTAINKDIINKILKDNAAFSNLKGFTADQSTRDRLKGNVDKSAGLLKREFNNAPGQLNAQFDLIC